MSYRLTIKDHAGEAQLYTRRAIIAFVMVVACLCTLITRLYILQIKDHEMYTTLSDNNRVNVVPIAPNRGLIYDRKGRLLADNTPTFSLELIPEQVPNIEETLDKLNRIISIREEDKQFFFRQLAQRRRFEGVPIRLQLSEKELAQFAVNRYQLPGVDIAAGLMRSYPLANITAHVLGYVGRMNENELRSVDPTNYSATQFIGKVGVEKTYEQILHGEVGYQQIETNARGRVVRVLNKTNPVPGSDLHLTIDAELELKAVEAMGDKRGAVIAMNPKNGEILAMVSNPSYDPNLFVMGINNKTYNDLNSSEDRPLFNRALRGQYSPGSTIKPILGLYAIDSGILNPQERFFDPGWFQLKNDPHKYRDWRRTGHGWVNLEEAITQSCSTYFYNLSLKMGIDAIHDALADFGFGHNTNIDIASEQSGIVPSPTWKRNRLHQAWYPGETLITAIGQGYTLITPIQLAQATAILANQGRKVQPHIVDFIEDSQRQRHTPEVVAQFKGTSTDIRNESSWKTIQHAMRAVITNHTGTAFSVFHSAKYTVAAKTGTAQVSEIKQGEEYHEEALDKKLRDNSLFISYAPVEDPQLVIVVVFENEKYGSRVARTLFDTYFGLRKQEEAQARAEAKTQGNHRHA